MWTMLLSMIPVQAILEFLAKRAGIAGALTLYRFNLLVQDNPGILQRFRDKQAEAAAKMQQASGMDRAKWVVESILAETGEVADDALKSLLYGVNGAVFYEGKFPPST
jgi:hypothetical protein